MTTIAELADARQQRLIQINDTATNRTLSAWNRIDYDNLDESWVDVGAAIVEQVTAAQFASVQGSTRYAANVATVHDFTGDRSMVIPEAFAGVDGVGREVEGVLYGAVTTTKTAVGAGLGRTQSLETGAAYLASIVKTLIADKARSGDMVAATGKGFTHYVRVVNAGACSRCAILAGISSYERAFKRHPACHCTAAPVVDGNTTGLFSSPEEYFDSLSEAEQERVFTKAGAQSIRDGAEPSKVVSARRGARGIGYSNAIGGTRQLGYPRGRFVKTTIGRRPDGAPVQVCTTSEGTTGRGAFGSRSRGRVRLMPESINEIAGEDLALRQAFLRDAGYMTTPRLTPHALLEQQRADRILVDRATRKFNNFYLG